MTIISFVPLRPQNFSDCRPWPLPLTEFKTNVALGFIAWKTFHSTSSLSHLCPRVYWLWSLADFQCQGLFFSPVMYANEVLQFLVWSTYSRVTFVVNLQVAPCWASFSGLCGGPTVQLNYNWISTKAAVSWKTGWSQEKKKFLCNKHVHFSPYFWFYLGNLKVISLVLIAGALPVLPVCF